jgi:secretion/DNA translocation related TadE-like protein
VSGDRGAATILILALCGFIAFIGIATAALGVMLSARERAMTAAESAALGAAVATYPPAATGSPGSVAAELARANGARLVSCWCDVDHGFEPRVVAVTVALTVDLPLFGEIDVGKTARARFDPRAWLGR